MTALQGVALFIAAVLAGGLNAVAGGGTFISFPVLIFTGVPAIPASATSAAALTPGAIASIAPYRADLAQEKRELLLFSLVSAAGGILGALVLSRTPSLVFQRFIPFLLLGATAIFAAGGRIASAIRRLRGASKPGATLQGATRATPGALAAVLALQFVIAFYGGFFGGGISIMMLAVFALLGMTNVHEMNALKVVLASVINSVTVIAFAILHLIWWPQAILMAVGAVAGGWGGATIAHWVPNRALRLFVIGAGVSLSVYFFIAYFVLK